MRENKRQHTSLLFLFPDPPAGQKKKKNTHWRPNRARSLHQPPARGGTTLTHTMPAPTRSLAGLPLSTRRGAFSHPAVEEAFWLSTHAAAARSYDVLAMTVLAVGHASACVLYKPRAVIVVTAALWTSLAAVWVARPKTAARVRTAVLPLAMLTVPLFGTANILYRHNILGVPLVGLADDARAPGWRAFWKTPRASVLAVVLASFILPPRSHAAAAAALIAATLASGRVSADGRAAFVGHGLHARAAAALSAARGWLGLPPAARGSHHDASSATLAVTLFLQLVLGVGGGCAGHALVSASLRRRFRERARGPPRTEAAAALDASAYFDSMILAVAAVAGVAVVLWWGLEHVVLG